MNDPHLMCMVVLFEDSTSMFANIHNEALQQVSEVAFEYVRSDLEKLADLVRTHFKASDLYNRDHISITHIPYLIAFKMMYGEKLSVVKIIKDIKPEKIGLKEAKDFMDELWKEAKGLNLIP